MTFPPAGANIYRNSDGEFIGYDMPAEPDYCDYCGVTHPGPCPADEYDDDLDDAEPDCENDEGGK